MSVGIFGARSSIARAFMALLPDGEEAILEPAQPFCDRFLFCSGFLAGGDLPSQTREQVVETWEANFARIAGTCDLILEHNYAARICIIGSDSAIKGSFDSGYAGAKAAMHLYIETKRLACAEQQLVGIAPTVIWDSGMTQRRPDLAEVMARGEARRKGRWLSAAEVAAAAVFLLYVDQGYISNTILRMNGGNW